jgi:hypothetical protein
MNDNNPFASVLQGDPKAKTSQLTVPGDIVDGYLRVLRKPGVTIKSVSTQMIQVLRIGLAQLESGTMATPAEPEVDLAEIRQRLRTIQGSADSALRLLDT